MIKPRHLLALSLSLFSILSLPPGVRADDASGASNPSSAPASKDLIDLTAADSDKKFTTDSQSGSQITVAHNDTPPGVNVTVAPGTAGYPATDLKPESPWDLSAYTGILVTITNTGTNKLTIGLRVDDSGGWKDNNSEMGYLDPGATKTVRVLFGVSFGKPGFNVNKASIAQLMIMTDKTSEAKTFRIESIKADSGTTSGTTK